MSTKRISLALLLPPALLAGGCVDQTNPNGQEVAGAAGANSAGANATADNGSAAAPDNGSAANEAAILPAPPGVVEAGKIANVPAVGDDKAEGSPNVNRGDVVVATRPAPADSSGKVTSPAGLLTGTLALRRNCLVIVGATGVTTLPIFRQGSFSWDPAEGALRYGGRSYRLGEKLTLPGGNLPRRSPFVAAHRAVIDRCATNDVFIVA